MARWCLIDHDAVNLDEVQHFFFQDEIPTADASIVFHMKNGQTHEVVHTDSDLLWSAFKKLLTDGLGLEIEQIVE